MLASSQPWKYLASGSALLIATRKDRCELYTTQSGGGSACRSPTRKVARPPQRRRPAGPLRPNSKSYTDRQFRASTRLGKRGPPLPPSPSHRPPSRWRGRDEGPMRQRRRKGLAGTTSLKRKWRDFEVATFALTVIPTPQEEMPGIRDARGAEGTTPTALATQLQPLTAHVPRFLQDKPPTRKVARPPQCRRPAGPPRPQLEKLHGNGVGGDAG